MDFVNKNTEIGEHKNTFLALEAKVILLPVAVSYFDSYKLPDLFMYVTFNLFTQVSDSFIFYHNNRYSVIWGSQPLRARNRHVEFQFLPNMPEILIYIVWT